MVVVLCVRNKRFLYVSQILGVETAVSGCASVRCRVERDRVPSALEQGGPLTQKRKREAWIVRICRALLDLLPAREDEVADGCASASTRW